MYWYIRRDDKVEGPFPAGQIQQSVLLGRLQMHDQVSSDKEEWQFLQQCPELIPDVMKGKDNDVAHQERLAAAKRWADERRFERREGEDESRLGPGRRDEEPVLAQEYRDHRELSSKSLQQRNDKSLFGLIAVVVFVVLFLAVAFLLPSPEHVDSECLSPVRPGINWKHCELIGLKAQNSDLTGAILSNANLQDAKLSASKLHNTDLSYANFQGASLRGSEITKARLTGADLRGANLSNTNFKGSDLSYVNLTNATIEGAVFTDAQLNNAIWIDGRVCKSGSVGQCR